MKATQNALRAYTNNVTTMNVRLWGAYALILLTLVAGTVAVSQFLPPPFDWEHWFHPAVTSLLHGESPYRPGMIYPPWTFLPLIPIGLAGQYGAGLLFMVSLIVLLGIAIKMGATSFTAILFLASPPVLQSLANGNMEWLVLAGLALRPRWGLFLVLIKPQIGAGVALFWLVEAWREGRLRHVLHTFLPVALAYAASFLAFGWWLGGSVDWTSVPENASLWPYSIPLGAGLLFWALHRRDLRPALAAAPFCSWYVLQHAYSGVVLASVSNKVTALSVFSLWWVGVLIAAT